MKISKYAIIGISLVVIIILTSFSVVLYKKYKDPNVKSNTQSNRSNSQNPQESEEPRCDLFDFPPITDKTLSEISVMENSHIIITNLLPYDVIEISFVEPNNESDERILVSALNPLDQVSIDKSSLKNGGQFIFRTNNMSKKNPIKYQIFNPVKYNCKRNCLYVGLVYSKNYLDSTTSYPIQRDMKYIRVHNLTLVPLNFGNIYVAPRDSTEYTGQEMTGISRGFKLVNKERIFEDVILTQNITDIYYGVISETIQPPLFQSGLVEANGDPKMPKAYLPCNWQTASTKFL